jgi:ABC-type spermidine/putrescine transport system permease subunit II
MRHKWIKSRLQAIGLIQEPLEFLLFSDFAVVLAFVHLYTLFMVIPIFHSMTRIDRARLAAAADCGASPWQVVREVVIPLSKPGMVIGSIFVVTLVMGDFVTVRLMSGGQSTSVGLMMMNQIALLQYPAAANAVILLVVTLLIVVAMVRIVDIRQELEHAIGEGRRPWRFYLLGMFFAIFGLFLYGPLSAIIILSFQGPSGGLTFPMQGVSIHWFTVLFAQQRVGDFLGAF